MEFCLTDAPQGAVPITLIAKQALPAWRDGADALSRRWIEATGFTAAMGKTALLPAGDGALARVLVGLGDDAQDFWALGGLPFELPEGCYRLDSVPEGADVTRLTLGWALGTYTFRRYKAGKPPAASLAWPEAADRGLVLRLARGMCLVRDLANTPAEDMGPEQLAAEAERVAAAAGARCRTIIGEDLLTENFPMVHTVGRASHRPPRLVDFVWGDDSAPKVTLVGKGVCFDTGGLDLKTATGMRMMKKDMAGAAIALGLAQAIMDAGLPVRLRVLLPMVENSVSGNAMRPLDVIRTRKGLTVEIGNTDAEGRLILSDALAAAASEKPAMIVDFATLTGAARVALGPELPVLFCNDEPLAAALLGAGTEAQDPFWRLPLWRPYRRLLDSKVADLNNVSEGPHAGAITAALFLEEFVEKDTPWAHIDVMAWNQRNRPGRPEGAEAQTLRAVYQHIAERFAGA